MRFSSMVNEAWSEFTWATTLSVATVTVVSLLPTSTLFLLNLIGLRSLLPLVLILITELPFETYTDALSGKEISKSSESVDKINSGIFTTVSHVAVRIARDDTSATCSVLDGVNVPDGVVTAHSLPVERISKTDFVTFEPSPQNGHVPATRALIGVMSMSPSPPVHAHSSSCGF